MDDDLAADGDGCRLVLTHTFDDRAGAASFAAGWDRCLDALGRVAGGRPAAMEPPSAALHERYARYIYAPPQRLHLFHDGAFIGPFVYGYKMTRDLELMKLPYTGCNPRGMMISRDKALSKQILSYHRIPTPGFAVFRKGQRYRLQRRLKFPLFVKSVTEDASLGISQASVVSDAGRLKERIEFIQEATAHLGNVRVEPFSNLVVEFARERGAKAIVKGLRAISDFEYEFEMNQLNRQLASDIESIYLMASPQYSFLSSSGVKEIATFGGDVSDLVPEPVARRLLLMSLYTRSHCSGLSPITAATSAASTP